MKASQRKSSKKELLLKTAQRLMLRRGYWATSVDEICVAASLSKGVFFHYFTSKKDLGEQTLQFFFNEIIAGLKIAFEAPVDEPLDRLGLLIEGISHFLSSPEGPQGCLVATFTIDTAEADEQFRERCAAYFSEWAQLLQTQLELAIDHYAPRRRLDSAQLSCYCISMIEGSLLLMRAGRGAAVLSNNTRLLMDQLRALLLSPMPITRPPVRSKRKSVA